MTPEEFTVRLLLVLHGIEAALWTIAATVAAGIAVVALMALLRRERRS